MNFWRPHLTSIAVFAFLLVGGFIYGQNPKLPDLVLTSDNRSIAWSNVVDQEWTLLYFYRGNW